MALFEIFGNRAAAEMRRIRAEEELRAREERLRRLIDGALDGIIDFDEKLRIHLINPSARKSFDHDGTGDQPASMHECFTNQSIRLIQEFMQSFRDQPGQSQAWIGRRLRGMRADGEAFEIFSNGHEFPQEALSSVQCSGLCK